MNKICKACGKNLTIKDGRFYCKKCDIYDDHILDTSDDGDED